jgi:hypothetical protein
MWDFCNCRTATYNANGFSHGGLSLPHRVRRKLSQRISAPIKLQQSEYREKTRIGGTHVSAAGRAAIHNRAAVEDCSNGE